MPILSSFGKILRLPSAHQINEGVVILFVQSIQLRFELSYICLWLDRWPWDFVHFWILEVHVVDACFFAFPAICCIVSHDSTVKTRSFGSSRRGGCLGNMDFFVFYLLIVLGYVCLKPSLRESSSRYIHWNGLVVHMPRGI